ncbi:UNVERIFIED_CONTAM: putative fructokinase-5 [Sesamum radiatum]|uniref:fructokinase n=1 Tax=Sesamum radiatum TaxID=300843 RepID=A0AAW2QD50_SESRA
MTTKSLIVCFGEMLIDFVPDTAGVSLAESHGFLKAPGGAPANVACAITKLGGSSAFIGKFQEESKLKEHLPQVSLSLCLTYSLDKALLLKRRIIDCSTTHAGRGRRVWADAGKHLKKNGVNSEGVRFDQQARTALAFVTLKHNGEREFMFYRNPSADMLLKESELDIKMIKQASIFHYGSISLISDPCRSAHMAAMKAAKEAGVLLSYDPNVRLPLWPSAQAARDGIKSIWNQADFIKVSDDEVEFLTQKDPQKEDVVMSLWHDQLKLLVITDGGKGCRYFTKSFKGKVDGFTVKTIDTTGAGDAFVGALLVSIAKNPSIMQDEAKLKEALTFANACGAIATTQKGAIPALPTMSDAQALIAQSKAK